MASSTPSRRRPHAAGAGAGDSDSDGGGPAHGDGGGAGGVAGRDGGDGVVAAALRLLTAPLRSLAGRDSELPDARACARRFKANFERRHEAWYRRHGGARERATPGRGSAGGDSDSDSDSGAVEHTAAASASATATRGTGAGAGAGDGGGGGDGTRGGSEGGGNGGAGDGDGDGDGDGPEWPQWLEDSFRGALATANTRARLLLVYLESDLSEQPTTDAFVRAALIGEGGEAARWLNQHFLLWGGNVAEADAYDAAAQFDVAAYPFLGVYLPSRSSRKFQRVFHSEGCLGMGSGMGGGESAEAAAAKLREGLALAVQRAAPAADELGAARVAADEDRRLREEQEQRYREALEADRARERESAAKREAEEEEARLREAVALSQQLTKETDLAKARERLRPEPERASHTAATPTTSLRIKLPTGEMVQRRFLSTDTVQQLRDFLAVTMADRSPPIDIGPYEVACNAPRRVFTEAEADTRLTMVEASLHPQAVLFVTAAAPPAHGED